MGGDNRACLVFGLERHGFVAISQKQREKLVCRAFSGEHIGAFGDFLPFPLG